MSRCSAADRRANRPLFRMWPRSSAPGCTACRMRPTARGGSCSGWRKKILLANQLGALVSAFRATKDGSVLYTWLYAVAFLLQIYYDFSGYSDMAIGLGRIFGFRFPENFNLSVYRSEHHGILAAVAHFARQLVPRLSLYPARRQPEGEGAAAFQHSDRLACNRTLARGRLELCAVGTVVRGAAAGRN